MYNRIVHANDGTDNSMRALAVAVDFAELTKAALDILFVEEINPHSGTIYEVRREKAVEEQRIGRQRRAVEGIAGPRGVSYKTHVFAGHPVAHIIEFVRERQADLLVIGATEHVSIIELIFGRRSDRIAHMAKCSVLIAR